MKSYSLSHMSRAKRGRCTMLAPDYTAAIELRAERAGVIS